MSEYLSKEEIKQWRSSLEKITLEDFAARLGKKIEEKKETNDLADLVLHGKPVISEEKWESPAEKLSSIADRAYEREREIYVSPFSAKNLHSDAKKSKPKAKAKETEKAVKTKTTEKKVKKAAPVKEKVQKNLSKAKTDDKLREEVRVVFKKALTDREQKVFDFFSEHKNEIVYAKDLATLLDLPRDYVYKYIKNLRAKIEGETLRNADKGGFILSV